MGQNDSEKRTQQQYSMFDCFVLILAHIFVRSWVFFVINRDGKSKDSILPLKARCHRAARRMAPVCLYQQRPCQSLRTMATLSRTRTRTEAHSCSGCINIIDRPSRVEPFWPWAPQHSSPPKAKCLSALSGMLVDRNSGLSGERGLSSASTPPHPRPNFHVRWCLLYLVISAQESNTEALSDMPTTVCWASHLTNLRWLELCGLWHP